MTDVSFALENAQEPANGRVGRRIAHLHHHLRRGRAFEPIENLQDLPFTTAQVERASLLRHSVPPPRRVCQNTNTRSFLLACSPIWRNGASGRQPLSCNRRVTSRSSVRIRGTFYSF